MTLKDEERTPCEVWTRIMGYYRPISNANIGKQQEHIDRTRFEMAEANWPAPMAIELATTETPNEKSM